jgi:glucose-6-phosphate 1-dehydrogenase
LLGSTKDEQAEQHVDRFLELCFYRAGQYDSSADFAALASEMSVAEASKGAPQSDANRVFYFALPPVVFVSCAAAIKEGALSKSGWNRLIVEKPFGHNYQSALTVITTLVPGCILMHSC